MFGLCKLRAKLDLWKELSFVRSFFPLRPWLLIAYFNATRSDDNRNGGHNHPREEEFISFFKGILNSQSPLWRNVDWYHWANVIHSPPIPSLDGSFSLEEVRRVIFALDPSKAPVPDGFPAFLLPKVLGNHHEASLGNDGGSRKPFSRHYQN